MCVVSISPLRNIAQQSPQASSRMELFSIALAPCLFQNLEKPEHPAFHVPMISKIVVLPWPKRLLEMRRIVDLPAGPDKAAFAAMAHDHQHGVALIIRQIFQRSDVADLVGLLLGHRRRDPSFADEGIGIGLK